MKKLTAFLVMLTLALSLAACASTSSDKENTPSSAPPQAVSQLTESNVSEPSESSEPSVLSSEPSQQTEETEAAGGKVFVVYYSASGNTARVAEDLTEAAGADLFEIVPSAPYTSADLNWNDSDSRVSREHNDETLRDVPLKTTKVANWDAYDTVLIGYPIWWGIAAWPVDNFVKGNDFSGKTAIPFVASSSSGMGESGTLLAEVAGTGNWQEGHRFASSASEEMVQERIAELGLNP